MNLKLSCPSRKLGPRFIGPFEIKKKINPVTFELSLPNTYKIHPVFHVSLLKPTVTGSFPGREDPPPPPVTVGEDTEFVVEAILDSRKRCRQIQYLVKWKGYSLEESSWEPAKDVHAPKLLAEFFRKYPEEQVRLGIRRLPLRGGHCQGTNRGRAVRCALHGPASTVRMRAQMRAMRMRAQTGNNSANPVFFTAHACAPVCTHCGRDSWHQCPI